MITSNVIHRTFHIRYGSFTGSAFAVDREGKQYLVTARHIVEDIRQRSSLGIFHERQWKDLPVDVVGVGDGEVDVTVLKCGVRLAPPHPLEASTEGMGYGQQVYFLGFPFGWDGGSESINREFPLPFVKAGVASALTGGDPSRIYVDGHNNKGFSGGPLVFLPASKAGSADFHVGGVISNYPTPVVEPIVDRYGEPILGEDGRPTGYFNENQGLVVAFDIRHAIDLIDANPVGFVLPQ